MYLNATEKNAAGISEIAAKLRTKVSLVMEIVMLIKLDTIRLNVYMMMEIVFDSSGYLAVGS